MQVLVTPSSTNCVTFSFITDVEQAWREELADRREVPQNFPPEVRWVHTICAGRSVGHRKGGTAEAGTSTLGGRIPPAHARCHIGRYRSNTRSRTKHVHSEIDEAWDQELEDREEVRLFEAHILEGEVFSPGTAVGGS